MKITFKQKIPTQKSVALIEVRKSDRDEIFKNEEGQLRVALGVKKPKKINNRKLILLVRKIVVLAQKNKVKKIALNFNDFVFPSSGINKEELGEILGTNLEMANYRFISYKEKPKEGWDLIDEVVMTGKVDAGIKRSIKKGKLIGESVNATRELANIPGGDMTPQILLQESRKAIRGRKIRLVVLNEQAMKKKKMGGVLSVGQGSKEPSKFIILEYKGAGSKQRPVVLVGKAVTFDTGGVNIKPFEAMKDMHMDMSGGAAVLQAIILAEKLKLKKNIVALIPAVENMPGGKSYRQGDIVRSMSGKTIEVGHTDAEGRIILADALTYAEKYKPKLVIDVATLTGAAMVALGGRASAVYASDEKYHKLLQELGEKSGDYVWPMPLWEEYEDEIKGSVGDISNIGKYQKGGGANTAAAFLYQFAKKYPWIHIDIAPRITSIDDEFLAKGAAGAPVRLLVKLLEYK